LRPDLRPDRDIAVHTAPASAAVATSPAVMAPPSARGLAVSLRPLPRPRDGALAHSAPAQTGPRADPASDGRLAVARSVRPALRPSGLVERVTPRRREPHRRAWPSWASAGRCVASRAWRANGSIPSPGARAGAALPNPFGCAWSTVSRSARRPRSIATPRAPCKAGFSKASYPVSGAMAAVFARCALSRLMRAGHATTSPARVYPNTVGATPSISPASDWPMGAN
jgi:hypothetical protein